MYIPPNYTGKTDYVQALGNSNPAEVFTLFTKYWVCVFYF